MKRFCISQSKDLLIITDRLLKKTIRLNYLNDTAKNELITLASEGQYNIRSTTGKIIKTQDIFIKPVTKEFFEKERSKQQTIMNAIVHVGVVPEYLYRMVVNEDKSEREARATEYKYNKLKQLLYINNID